MKVHTKNYKRTEKSVIKSFMKRIKTSPIDISPQLFHSKLETLLITKSYPDSSSSPYLPPRLNSKHHPT